MTEESVNKKLTRTCHFFVGQRREAIEVQGVQDKKD